MRHCAKVEQVFRSALVNQILAFQYGSVVLLQSPAGHGKSTLMQQLAEQLQRTDAVAMAFRVHHAHNDSSRFFDDFQSALEKLLQTRQQPVVTKPKSQHIHFSDRLIAQLQRFSGKITLLLDDLHLITNRTILAIIAQLLDRRLDNLKVVIACREIPHLGMERLLLSGHCLLLDAKDLRFTLAETQHFFGTIPSGIDSASVAQIHSMMEGWPAGLQLLRLTVKDRHELITLRQSPHLDLPMIANYLIDNVLYEQAPQIQQFLMRTAFLKTLEAPLCAAITAATDSQHILETLEASGIFLKAQDHQHQRFSYHPLFANVLQHQLVRTDPEAVTKVHTAALRWYQLNSQPELALHHAHALRDYPQMAAILEDWASQLIIKAQLETVEHWFNQLPTEVVACRPTLTLRVVWALIFLHRFEKLNDLMDILAEQQAAGLWPDTLSIEVVTAIIALMHDDISDCQRIVDNIDVSTGIAHEFRSFELSAVANMQALLRIFAGDFDSARELNAISHAYSANVNAVFSDSYACGVNAFYLLARADAQQAYRVIDQEAAKAGFYLAGMFSSTALISTHGWILYERNQLDDAQQELESSLSIIISASFLDWMAMAFVTLLRIYSSTNAEEKRESLFRQAESIAYVRGWPRLQHILLCEQLRHHLLRKETVLAYSVNKKLGKIALPQWPSGFTCSYADVECDAVRQLRLALHTKEPDWEPALTVAIASAENKGRRRRLLTLLILASLFEFSRKQADWVAPLARAINLAAQSNYVRCFIDEGPMVGQMLATLFNAQQQKMLTQDNLDIAYVENLVTHFGLSDQLIANPTEQSGEEFITFRERQILALVAAGKSNKSIASSVFLSENTVKFHLKNIYPKLGAKNRTEAASIAREKDLI